MNWKISELLFGVFEVSEMADIRNVSNGEIRKKHLNKRLGRYYITIRYNGHTYCKKVSRVVAEAFIPNPHNYSDVNHINGDKTDDRVENLEWCTRQRNRIHYLELTGKLKVKKETVKKTFPISVCLMDGSLVEIFPSARKASLHTKTDREALIKICKSGGGHKNGYKFSYAIEPNPSLK